MGSKTQDQYILAVNSGKHHEKSTQTPVQLTNTGETTERSAPLIGALPIPLALEVLEGPRTAG